MYKHHYTHFLNANPGRLHFAAHSHHLWPDVTRDAQLQYWDDSARYVDQKWERIFGELIPEAQNAVAAVIGISYPERIAFAPNTHELLVRLLSSLPRAKPVRVLTSDSEFHSAARQFARLEEENFVVERIATRPFSSFQARFCEALDKQAYDLVFLSHVFFNTGCVNTGLAEIVERVRTPETLIVIDGYHAFCAIPVNISRLEQRVYYLGGGYKYGQAGEGASFMYIPPGCRLRPVNTGWLSEFGQLTEKKSVNDRVSYSDDAYRFGGATFDPTGLYRLRAVMRWMNENDLSVDKVHRYVQDLQCYFLSRIPSCEVSWMRIDNIVHRDLDSQGHFFTFELERAAEVQDVLLQRDVVTDVRGNFLRFGFGLYQDRSDIDQLFSRLGESSSSAEW